VLLKFGLQAIDTAEGMRYLHELDPPIVHADIRGVGSFALAMVFQHADFIHRQTSLSRATSVVAWLISVWRQPQR
jgi:hypothetical protein